MLSHCTLTEGTWLKFEEFAVNLLQAPDFTKLSNEEKQEIERAFDKAHRAESASLIDQLQNGFEGRRIIDDLMVELVGIESFTCLVTSTFVKTLAILPSLY
jgi:hypothetical protein